MEVYASVLLFLTSSFLVIVSPKSILKRVEKSNKDPVAGVALKARLKNKNFGNVVNISVVIRLHAEDLHDIMSNVLDSPYYTISGDSFQNEAFMRLNDNIEKTSSTNEAIFRRLDKGIQYLKKLESDIKNFLLPDRSGKRSSRKDTGKEKESSFIIDDGMPIASKKFETPFDGLTQLDTDQGRRTASKFSRKMNLLHKLRRTVEECSESAQEHPGSKKKTFQHFNRFDLATPDSDRRSFRSNGGTALEKENESLSKLSTSIENLRQEILLYKLQRDQPVERFHDEIDDRLLDTSSKNASEYRSKTVNQYNPTCISAPIDKNRIPIQSTNTERDEVLVRIPLNDSLPELDRFSDEEPKDFGKTERVEPLKVTPVLEGTALLLPTRPSLKQQIEEAKDEHSHGSRSSISRSIESNGTRFPKGNDTSDDIAAGKVFLRKLGLVEKPSMERKQPEAFDLSQTSNDSMTPVNETDHFSVFMEEVERADRNGANARRFEYKTETGLPKKGKNGYKRASENNTVNNSMVLSSESEKFFNDDTSPDDEGDAGHAMKELIGSVHAVIPPLEKHSASKLKLKSRRFLTRSNHQG